MPYQPQIFTAMKRTALVLSFLCLSGASAFGVIKDKSGAIAEGAASNENSIASPQTPSASPSPSPSVAISPSSDKLSQSAQGRQYGQAGFVGEPINLNVVNADIRDILNYITEQYGVNFIIDSSVGAVPVTVNVQDVPWNVALDAILKANRLGIEVSGNILRVATTTVLASEAGTQRVINESRLEASPLITEFIRLNYARASGSLQSTAGAAGGFAGGQASGATSAAAGGGGAASGGDN